MKITLLNTLSVLICRTFYDLIDGRPSLALESRWILLNIGLTTYFEQKPSS